MGFTLNRHHTAGAEIWQWLPRGPVQEFVESVVTARSHSTNRRGPARRRPGAPPGQLPRRTPGSRRVA